MTREEAITNLNMIRVAFGVPVTKEQKELVDETFEMAIQALSQEPKAEKPMCDRNICLNNEYDGIGCDECVVNKAEQEHKSGKWEFHCQHWSKCSICGYADKFADKWNYCPNCGAKMENVEKSLIDIKAESGDKE